MRPTNPIRITLLPLLTTVWRDHRNRWCHRNLSNRKVLVRGVRNRLFAGRGDFDLIGTARSYRGGYLPRMFTITLGTFGYP